MVNWSHPAAAGVSRIRLHHLQKCPGGKFACTRRIGMRRTEVCARQRQGTSDLQTGAERWDTTIGLGLVGEFEAEVLESDEESVDQHRLTLVSRVARSNVRACICGGRTGQSLLQQRCGYAVRCGTRYETLGLDSARPFRSANRHSPPDRKNKGLCHRVAYRRPTRFRWRVPRTLQRNTNCLAELPVG